jgi:hypothetical protein
MAKLTACKYCGRTGMEWRKQTAGWRLFEAATGDQHRCLKSGTAAPAAASLSDLAGSITSSEEQAIASAPASILEQLLEELHGEA